MCVWEKTCTLFFVYLFFFPLTLTLILPFISLSLLLGITEFCYAFLACVRTLSCFSEKAYLQNQQWGAWESAHVCAWLRLSFFALVAKLVNKWSYCFCAMLKGNCHKCIKNEVWKVWLQKELILVGFWLTQVRWIVFLCVGSKIGEKFGVKMVWNCEKFVGFWLSQVWCTGFFCLSSKIGE